MSQNADVHTLLDRLAAAEQRIGELEAKLQRESPEPSEPRHLDGRPKPGDSRQSRRDVFKFAGGAAAGMTALALLKSQPASAADGSSIIIGQSNTGEAQTTLQFDGLAGTLSNSSTVPPSPLPLLDLDASTSSTSATGGGGSGGNALEAIGDVGNTGIVGLASGGVGVLGLTSDLGGVVGEAVSATFGAAPDYGIDLVAIGNGNLGQFALPSAGLTNGKPNFISELAPTGFELVRDDAGGLWSSDSSGAFHPVLSVVPLAAPVRVINTTDGTGGIVGPLTPSATPHVSNALAGTNGIPATAVGVVGNLAISGVGGALLNGFGVATIFPAGIATPSTANINAGNGCFAISNTVTVAFGTGLNAGKVSIVWNGGGPVQSAHAFLDVIGFLQ